MDGWRGLRMGREVHPFGESASKTARPRRWVDSITKRRRGKIEVPNWRKPDTAHDQDEQASVHRRHRGVWLSYTVKRRLPKASLGGVAKQRKRKMVVSALDKGSGQIRESWRASNHWEGIL